MSIKTAKFIIAPLRGMDQRWDTQANRATNIENMTWSDQDSWRSSQGYKRLVPDYEETETLQVGDNPAILTLTGNVSNAYDDNAVPNSLYWFSQHGDSLQWLVYEDRDGRLQHFNGSKAPNDPKTIIQYTNGEAIDGTTRVRASKGEKISGSDFAMFGQNLYIVNGVDAPLVFDGRKCTRAGFSGRPRSPIPYTIAKHDVRETFLTGVGYEGSDNEFKYLVTFLNERGQESQISMDSTKLSFNTTDTSNWTGYTSGQYKKFVCVNIPLGPVGTVARRIYRTQNLTTFIEGSGVVTFPRENIFSKEYFLLDEIQDNVTQIYVDGLSDFDLGAIIEKKDFGEFPKGSKIIAVYKNTVFVAGDTTSELRYSRPMRPEMFPRDNVFDFSDTQTSIITALYPTRDSLVVFKSRGIYLIKGDPLNGFFGQTLTTDIGCIAHNSIREVPSVGLVFLAMDGVYVLSGTLTNTGSTTNFFKLSQPLRDVIDRVNFEFSNKFRSLVYHRDREYWLSVCLDEQTEPETILKFSYEINAWSVYTTTPVAGMIETQDHRGYLIFAGSSDTEADGARGLYVYGGTNTKGLLGQVSSVYETVNIPFNSVYENFSPARVQARMVGFGNTLNMSVHTNREPGNTATSASGTQTRPLEDQNFPLYDTVTTNTGATYKEHRPVIVRMDFSTMHKGPVNELKLRFTCSDEMEIVNYELEARVGTRRNVVNLTEKFGGSATR